MSINSALLAGASGLISNSSALAAISDNIANVNTVGYKRANSVFTPLYDAGGSTSTRYSAAGVRSVARLAIGESGLLTAGTSTTDLAISGRGFFVVRDTPTAGTNDPVAFTRAGRFTADDEGFLRNDAGMYLSGWPVAADGTVPQNPSDLNTLETINLSSIGGAAEATTTMTINANLQSSQTVSAAEATYAAGTSANNMASGNVTPDFQRSVPFYDSVGGVRSLTISLLKSSTPNQWHAEIHMVPPGDIATGAGLVDGQMATGTVAFDAQGRLDTTNTTLPTSLDFLSSTNTAALGANQFQWAAATGVDAQSVELDFGSPNAPGGFTQYDSPSALLSTNVNGSAFGNFASVDVDEDGFVFAKFTNGIVRKIYQVPVATFVNPDGLEAQSGGTFTVTPESGAYTLSPPGLGTAGNIAASTLESSNVDLATEFTSLITTQRAYSASSKIITTADEMLDEAIRMKR
ncbi:flagellar hook protein FlgE [Maricaulis alexandrii]|jgi:flagellar hook protein FlgE|uniref:flagellar hook protein FlgE n=1 Tax=Maricaulis alexandrii TaxID=2570354 RepID=UPI001107A9EB|nr:flagellar hook protein FlgE [Maricaulis alexandrii]